MPMVLMNAPATFMQTMNNLFMDMLDRGVVIFSDNMLIYSTVVEEHSELLEKGVHTFAKVQILLQAEKVQLLSRTTTFLGFDITPEGL